jgi:hypothetical protein
MSSKPHVNSYEMIENSKKGDKMCEKRNSNIDSSEKTGNSKSVIEMYEVPCGKEGC